MPHLEGSTLGLIWVIPFAAMLLSIALFPLVLPRFWHRNFGKVAAFWALLVLIPLTMLFGWRLALYELLHAAIAEYLPFIVLLLSLFTVSGGVRVTGRFAGTPLVNAAILLAGTVIASWMGTTGAAMLLIRPLLHANEGRRYKVHTVIFFIFLVANIGGALSPLGDPPLFLGFLQGVAFFWPTTHLLLPMLLVSGSLLALYLMVDMLLYRREIGQGFRLPTPNRGEGPVVALQGARNIVLLAGIIGAVLMSGLWRPGITFEVFHVEVALQNLVRDGVLLMLAALSWRLTSHTAREANGFSWFPIVEVAKLFAGIFVTIIPVLAILQAGRDGALAPVVALVSQNGQPNDAMYFWLTGLLSSFLDNAPTYLVFFNIAGGDAQTLMGPMASTLIAISAGAVFMGAMTYIGNAPNFMIRAIAEERGVPMPSFFGYMLWSVGILVPVFGIVTVVFFP